MRFRPCIDIHNGKVKQIIGSTLRDEGDSAQENFVSEKDASYYAKIYKDNDLPGGHVIMLNPRGTGYYEATLAQALLALSAYPGGLMAGGGIDDENAGYFIDAGASHVIVTSFVFSKGTVNSDNLKKLEDAVGRDRIVLDLSCRKTDRGYMIATDRWQNLTDVRVDEELLETLSDRCDEFLVHAVDTEGKSSGIDEQLIRILAASPIPVCYAGGVSSYDDILRIKEAGSGRVDVTVGSKLDFFGGDLSLQEIIRCTR